MALVSIIIGVASAALVVASMLVWRGRIQPFPSSVRLSHTGVLFTAGLFGLLSSSLTVVAGDHVHVVLRLFAGGVWLLSLVALLWMFSQTPNQWASRMARMSERQFDARWVNSRTGPKKPESKKLEKLEKLENGAASEGEGEELP